MSDEMKARFAEKVKPVSDTVISGYQKIEDAFVDKYLAKDGETIEEAKERIDAESQQRRQAKAERKAVHRDAVMQRKAEHKERIGK